MMNKFTSIFLALGLLFVCSCTNPENEKKPVDVPPTPTDKTYVKFTNNSTMKVDVFTDVSRMSKLATINSGSSSQEIETQPNTTGAAFYLTYYVNIGSVDVPFSPSDVTVARIDGNIVNNVTITEPANVSTNFAYLILENSSSADVSLANSNSEVKPFGLDSTILRTGETGVYQMAPGSTELIRIMRNTVTPVNLPSSMSTLNAGNIYALRLTDNEIELLTLAPFNMDTGNNVWSIPSGTELNRSLTVGFFAPRANPADGYLVLGNINARNIYASNSYYKAAPYFATIDQKGNVVTERILPFPAPNPNQSFFRRFIEDTNEYVFFGQRKHEGEHRPFILGITPGTFAINYYYTGFTDSIEEDHQSLDSISLVKVGNRQYGVACNLYDADAHSIFIANVTTTWNSASHSELWRSPDDEDMSVVDMIYDPDLNTYIVLAEDYQFTGFAQRTLIYFIDAGQPQTEKFNSIEGGSHTFFKKIVKVGADYYVLGFYDNPAGRGEGILQKLDPATGTIAWDVPERFTPKDTFYNLGVSNLISDNGRLILAGYTNADDVYGNGGNPWICAFDPVTKTKLWETEYAEYVGYTVYSIYSNGIGSYILELYSEADRDSLLVSTDLMGRPAETNSAPLPRSASLNYAVQEVGTYSQIAVELEPVADVAVTPPVLQIPKGQTGTFTVSGTYAKYEWYIDGDLRATGSGVLILNASILTRGVHNVSVVATTSTGERRSASYTVMVTN